MSDREARIRQINRRRATSHGFHPGIEVCEARTLLSLNLALGVNDATPNVGDIVTFSLSVTNIGSSINGVQVNDLLPAGLTFSTSTASQGSYDGNTGLWNVGTLAGSATATLTLKAFAAFPGDKINTAVASGGGFSDSKSITVTPQQVNVSVGTSVNGKSGVSDPIKASVDQGVTFTVVVSNAAGYTQARDIIVSDVMSPFRMTLSPADPQFLPVNPKPSQGSYNYATGVWNVGTLDPGSAATLSFQVFAPVTTAADTKFIDAATLTQVHNVDGGNVPNANFNPTSSAAVIAQKVFLGVSQAVDNSAPGLGSAVTFTVVVSNAAGFSQANSVNVSEILPAGLAYITSSQTKGQYNPGSGQWNVGTLDPGASATLTVSATVLSVGNKTVTASATADRFNANPNPTSSVTLSPPLIDLSLTQTASNTSPSVGDNITFTVTAGNASGFNAATDVNVLEPLPVGLSFVSATTTQGLYNSATGVWTLGTVNSGASATLTLVAKLTAAKPLTVTATATADQPNATPNPSATVFLNPVSAVNLSISQTVDKPAPGAGTNVTFTITLREAAGAANAAGIQVNDLLPAGLTFVSASPSQGSYNAGTGLWNVGSLSSGGSAKLQLVAAATAPFVTVTNTATITSVTPNNNIGVPTSASASVTATQSSVTLSQTVDQPNPAIGDVVKFSITIKNVGPAGYPPISDAQVADLLPPGLAFVSATSTQGVYNSAVGLWSVGALALGGSATLQISAQVLTGGTTTNTATITGTVPVNINPAVTASASVTAAPYDLSDLLSVSYLINGKKTVNALQGNVHTGDTVEVKFTLASGKTERLSLVSYNTPRRLLGGAPTGPPSVSQSATGVFTGGPNAMTVTIPNSAFEIDFVFGQVISVPDLSGGPNSYGAQGRLIDVGTGGFLAFGSSSVSSPLANLLSGNTLQGQTGNSAAILVAQAPTDANPSGIDLSVDSNSKKSR